MPKLLKYKRDKLLLKYLGITIATSAVIGAVLYIGSQCWCFWKFCAWLGTIFMAITVLVSGFTLVVLAYKWIKQDSVVIVAFVCIFVFGVGVYYTLDDEVIDEKRIEVDSVARILSPLNNTLSIFFPSRGDNSIEETGSWKYQLAQVLAYLFAAATLFSLFGRKSLNRICIYFISSKDFGVKNVFWGYSDNCVALAKDIANKDINGEQLFIFALQEMGKDDFKSIFEKLDEIGGIVYFYSEDSFAKRVKRLSGYRQFFMTEDQDANVGMSIRLIQTISDDSPSETGIYLRSEVENIGALYTQYAGKKIQLHLVNYSDCIARKFVTEHPIIDAVEKKPGTVIDTKNCTVKGDFNILVIGMGWVGLEIVKKSLCDGQFLGDFNLTITAIDKDYENAHGWYESIFDNVSEPYKEEFNQRYHIEINPSFRGERVSNANSTLFYEWLDDRTSGASRILKYDRVIVALGDDKLSIETALHIHNFRLRRFESEGQLNSFERIFVNIKNSTYIKAYDDKRFVSVFGDLGDSKSEQVFLNYDSDILAKLVNYVYSRYGTNDGTFTKQALEEAINHTYHNAPFSANVEGSEYVIISHNGELQYKRDSMLWSEQDLRKSEEECKTLEKKYEKYLRYGKNDKFKEKGIVDMHNIQQLWPVDNFFNQSSSRAVAMNIRNAYRVCGCVDAEDGTLNSDRFATFIANDSNLEILAEMEHLRWNAFHYVNGVYRWRNGKVPDEKKLRFFDDAITTHHDCLVPYKQLPLKTKNIDRRIVRHFPILLEIINSKNHEF